MLKCPHFKHFCNDLEDKYRVESKNGSGFHRKYWFYPELPGGRMSNISQNHNPVESMEDNVSETDTSDYLQKFPDPAEFAIGFFVSPPAPM